MLGPEQITRFRDLLVARQEELEALQAQTKSDRDAVELDQSKVGRLSRMDALQMQAMAQEAERRRALERQKISSALKRIDTDDFGYCVTCDEEIGLKRLENDPSVPTCIDCATR